MSAFSLPTQRCFYPELLRRCRSCLFSAYAEVFLQRSARITALANFSLPTQRCFSGELSFPTAAILFSAYAEVFPAEVAQQYLVKAFLCLRRGVSKLFDLDGLVTNFSLPTQRCFQPSAEVDRRCRLFSAYAEVFLTFCSMGTTFLPFLCLRRGVSYALSSALAEYAFSLPTQRCFPARRPRFRFRHLFSAYAEVFPYGADQARRRHAFLCLRRGVSGISGLCRSAGCFSLPTQRCFYLAASVSTAALLFSAYAEVFPDARTVNAGSRAFLCLRRGVSRKDPVGAEADALFSAYAEVFPCESTEWKP